MMADDEREDDVNPDSVEDVLDETKWDDEDSEEEASGETEDDNY